MRRSFSLQGLKYHLERVCFLGIRKPQCGDYHTSFSFLSPLLIVEVNVEKQCHVTKDTSSTGRSNDETQITSSPSATQSCYEEPQPSTSTSNLFNASSTSLIESASVQQDNPSTSGKNSVKHLKVDIPSIVTPVLNFKKLISYPMWVSSICFVKF